MKKLVILVSLVFAMFVSSVIVNAAPPAQVEVSMKSSFNNGNKGVGKGKSNKNIGDVLALDSASIGESNEFSYWVINGFIKPNMGANAQIRVQSKMDVHAVFHTSGEHAVLFVDSNGKLIELQYVAEGGTAIAPATEGYSKPGGLVVDSVNPWKSLEGESNLTGINASKVYVLQYTQATGVINILIEGGLVETIEVAKNEMVIAAAADTDTFTHWADENGNVVSYNPTFAFTALEDAFLFAESSEVTPTSFITMKDLTGIRTGYESYMGRFELQGDDYLIEYGFIYSNTTEDITFDTTDVVIAKSNIANTQTNEFLMSFVSEHHVTTRAYAIIDNGTEIVTIYSDLIVKNEPTTPEPTVEILHQSDFGETDGWGAYGLLENKDIENGSEDPTPTGTSKWDILGGNVNGTGWDYIRMGGKAASEENPATVYMATRFSFSETVTEIIVNIVALDGATGEEILYLQTSVDGSVWTTVSSKQTIVGDLTFDGLNIASNSFFRFVFERESSGTKNKGTDIKTITFSGF
ncbi:MAG: hypothetical protein RBQ91_05165 [Acholeplasma sp.]|nr:hypothetical protein [Acholeplasma sp.]